MNSPKTEIIQPFFWFSIKVYKGGILAERYGIKCGSIGNRLGTHWNLGTYWEHNWESCGKKWLGFILAMSPPLCPCHYPRPKMMKEHRYKRT
jgi:hypothetical protein